MASDASADSRLKAVLAEAGALEMQLAEARTMATTIVDGRFSLSVASLAAIEGELLPRIEKLQARAVGVSVPAAVYRLATPSAREVWEEFDLPQQRTAIRSLLTVTLHPGGRGVKKVTPDRFNLDWKV